MSETGPEKLKCEVRGWDGHLPLRRYAIFRDVLFGDYAIVVTGKDLTTAPKWGGFVSWLGGVKPAETRTVASAKKSSVADNATTSPKSSNGKDQPTDSRVADEANC